MAEEVKESLFSTLAGYMKQAEISNIDKIYADFFKQLKPKPRLTVSEWSDRYRFLPSESSAEPGIWKTSRAPYLQDIMNAVNDPAVETVVVETCSQIGKSEALNNILFYYAHQDPCPILFIQPTLTDAEDYSKSRLSPSIRDSPELFAIFGKEKSRSSSSTIYKKNFTGGRVVLVGANSPSGLSSKPIRIVLADEVDRYEITKEGSALRLAMKRTSTFFNKKIIITSTPSVTGISEIDNWYKLSDQRKFYVPCGQCGNYILLKWEQVVWDKDENGTHKPETAKYCCQKCGVILSDGELKEMVRKGEWRATASFRGIAGFGEFPAMYSPWVSLESIVKEFLDAKDDSDDLRVWVNTVLGQSWEEKNEKIDHNDIFNRREIYSLTIPKAACFITCSADIQKDRIEALVVAWGFDEEAWVIEHRIFYGDTSAIELSLKNSDVNQMSFEQVSDFDAPGKVDGVWKQFDDFLQTTYEHESGELFRISTTAIDTGFETEQVYNYVRPRQSHRGVCAIKGDDGHGKEAVSRPSTKNKGKVKLYTISTFKIKDSIKARLGKNKPGPGYIHFPDRVDLEFCEQLASEKKVIKKHRGHSKIEWVKTRTRNEAWDLLCYNFAALRIKFKTRDIFNKYVNSFYDKIREKENSKEKKEEKKQTRPIRQSKNFAKNW